MPKRSSSRKNPRDRRQQIDPMLSMLGGGNGSDVTSTDRNRNLQAISISGTTGNGVLLLSVDSMGTRGTALAQVYALYRFKRLRITLYPAAAAYAFGVIIGPTDATAATTFTQSDVIACPFSAYVPSTQTMPTEIIVPASALNKGQQRWYQTELSSSDNSAEIQVTLLVSAPGGTVSGIAPLVAYDAEFCDPVAAATIPRPKTMSVSQLAERLEKLEARTTTPIRR